MSKFAPYEYVKIIAHKQIPDNINEEEFYKNFQPYIVMRYFSMDKRFLYHTLILNRYTFDYGSNEKKKDFFNLMYNFIPKKEVNFIRYIKGTKQVKYPEEVYTTLRKIHGEHLSITDINWIIEYMINTKNLNDELRTVLLQTGLDYKELVKYFPSLFSNDEVSKVNNFTIKKEVKNLLKQKEKEKEQKNKETLDNLL